MRLAVYDCGGMPTLAGRDMTAREAARARKLMQSHTQAAEGRPSRASGRDALIDLVRANRARTFPSALFGTLVDELETVVAENPWLSEL